MSEGKSKRKRQEEEVPPALFLSEIPRGGAHNHPDLSALAALIDEDDSVPKKKEKTSTIGTTQVELALL